MPKLTIGMAHFDDFDGVYFTVQALRTYHAEAMKDVEIIVVDNNPSSMVSQQLQQVIENKLGEKYRYIPMDSPVGTSPARDRIFQEAQGEYVLVLDCHVLLWPDSLQRLLDFYSQYPDTKDLYQGPIVYDALRTSSTHFNDQWRDDMWGTWGSAWLCNCGQYRFSVMQDSQNDKRAIFVELKSRSTPIESCPVCGTSLMVPSFYGHQRSLVEQGHTELGHRTDEEPFEIPGQGLWLFSCRKDAWLGFNKDSRQFGGEELYIHEKFRAAGRKCWCLPFMRGVHRFNRPKGAKYPLSLWGKARNYVLEFNELNRPDLLEEAHQHFIRVEKPLKEGDPPRTKLNEEKWKYLIADPVHHLHPPNPDPNTKQEEKKEENCQSCGQEQKTHYDSIDTAFQAMLKQKRDLNQHMEKFRELASICPVVTEIGKRRESTIAFLQGKPKVLRSYSTERIGKNLFDEAKANGIDVTYSSPQDAFGGIEPTDLLFLDFIHTYSRTKQYLHDYAPVVRRFIVFHDTHLHKHKGEDGSSPGLLKAIVDFVKENKQWSVIYYTEEQYGLMVLSCNKSDKPKVQPGILESGKNWIKAMADYKASGNAQASPALYQARLDVCAMCLYRKNDQCTVCGCYLTKGPVPGAPGKAAIKVQDCPLGYWPSEAEVEANQ